jgi:thiol-disulfide isomerase/thioredoxin
LRSCSFFFENYQREGIVLIAMKRSVISTLVPILAIALYFGGRYIYFRPSHTQGEKAPAFSAMLANGEAFSLAEMEGRYVLLDFWGSWCPPCRAQNPKWVALHRQYEEKGFAIVSIGVETKEDRWANAIRNDSLYWSYHILDKAGSLRFFDSPLAVLYGVKQLPTTFLLDPQGMIIAYDPKPRQVEAILEQAFGKN